MKKGHPLKRRQSGVVAIEFALGVMAFLLMVFYWIEVSYLGFVNSVVDYAVVEASRVSRYDLDGGDYTGAFVNEIKKDSLWGQFLDVERFGQKVTYFKTRGELASGVECTGTSKDSPLAIYELSYSYQPLFVSLFIPSGETMNITREAIMVQEHERSKFE